MPTIPLIIPGNSQNRFSQVYECIFRRNTPEDRCRATHADRKYCSTVSFINKTGTLELPFGAYTDISLI